MPCPICKVHELVVITVELGDTDVTIHSCSDCDARWWTRDGRPVSLDDVLAATADRR